MNPEEKGSRLLWNVGITLPNHKASHPRQSQLSMHIKADVNFQKKCLCNKWLVWLRSDEKV